MAKEKKFYKVKYIGEPCASRHGKIGAVAEFGKVYRVGPFVDPPNWNNFEIVTGTSGKSAKKATAKKTTKKKATKSTNK